MYELWHFDFGTGFETFFTEKQVFLAINMQFSIVVSKITVF